MRKTVTITTAAVFLGLSGFAIAQDQDPVKARQDTMKTIGAQMKVLSDMAKGTTAFDADAANAALGTMTEAAETIPVVFETESIEGETDASEDIWANWEDFVSKAEALHEAAMGAEVTDEASLGAAMQGVGGACAACHKAYKL